MDNFIQRVSPSGLSLAESTRFFLRRFVKEPLQSLHHSVERLQYHSVWRRQLGSEAANRLIFDLVSSNAPCLVGRIGHTEGRIVGEYLFRNRRFGRLTRKEAHQYSGIFPVEAGILSRFAEVYWSAIQEADILGYWQTAFQARIISCSQAGIELVPLSSLEPYLHPFPWSSALAGKTVLVVHPFASTIASQYRLHRSSIFSDSRVLPCFNLVAISPPQTLAPLTSGYNDWLHAMNVLTENVLGHDFDIALLGCGAYGLPLGASIKAAGRKAIHLGGALQVMFGIRGKRWEAIPGIASMMNDQWVRPSEEETPPAASMVDGGCYW